MRQNYREAPFEYSSKSILPSEVISLFSQLSDSFLGENQSKPFEKNSLAHFLLSLEGSYGELSELCSDFRNPRNKLG